MVVVQRLDSLSVAERVLLSAQVLSPKGALAWASPGLGQAAKVTSLAWASSVRLEAGCGFRPPQVVTCSAASASIGTPGSPRGYRGDSSSPPCWMSKD